MTDPLDRLLRPPEIEPLAPPAGRYAEIRAGARRRRQRRARLAGLLSVVAVAGALGGGALLARTDLLGDHANPPQQGTSVAGSASPSATPQPAPLAAGGPVPAGFRPRSVSYASGRTGYLLGDAPCPRPICTSLVRTTDEGATWQGVPAPVVPLSAGDPQAGHVRDVRFATPQDGWVFGGALYSTHDAGAHWTKRTLPGLVTDLATDGRTAYALVAGCPAGACRGYRLFATPADADDWRSVPGVDAPTASAGWLAVTGSGAAVGLSTDVGPAIWVRHGDTWRPALSVPCAAGPPLSALAASASGGRLVALCGEGAAGSLFLTPWVSDDSGATWRKAAGTPARAVTGSLSVAAATDRLLLMAAGNRDLGGSVLRSVDGGRTFAAADLPRVASGWSFVGARSATALVALPGTPDGSVWRSADSGLTWHPYRFG